MPARLARATQPARLGLTLRRFLAKRIDPASARAELQRRLEERDDAFLRTFSDLDPAGPYAELLRWAGCAPGDLRGTVRAHGLDRALELLRDAGVYVTHGEFRGRSPIVRDGLEIPFRANAFDNPRVRGRALGGRTSGTGAAARPVLVSWASVADEAVGMCLLLDAHGLSDLPLAQWLPPPPGLAGVKFVMFNARRGHPPERWFSPVAEDLPGTALGARVLTRGLPVVGRSVGLRIPRPELVRIGEESSIARWMAEAVARSGSCVVRTSASGAVRVAEAAQREAIDVSGGVMLVAGEPLTPARHRAIAAAGLRAVPFYGCGEAGLLAGGCERPAADDDMHVWLDRLAAIPLSRVLAPDLPPVDAVLLTSLTAERGQVLLNVEIGDHARFERRACGCPLGALGLDLHVSTVRSHDKLTGCGMALLGGQFDDAVAACIERAGGGPNDFQFRERVHGAGPTRLVLNVSPDVPIDESGFVASVLDELRATAPGGNLVAEIWRSAETLELTRERSEPRVSLKTRAFVPARS